MGYGILYNQRMVSLIDCIDLCKEKARVILVTKLIIDFVTIN